MKKDLYYYIFVFLVATMLGWIGELIWRSIYFEELVNPGALVGPFCPIYGVASILLFITLKKENGIIVNILNLVIVSTLVEYLTAVISEEIFNRKLWSYSHLPLNFQGRVCLYMTIVFVVVGLICFYFFKPYIDKFVKKHPIIVKDFDIVFGIFFLFNVIIQSIAR